MANMSVDNLQQIVQSGNTERLFESPAVSDMRVQQEMRNNGMDASSAVGAAGGSDAASNANTFADILHNSVEKVNTMQTQADQAIANLVAGRTKNIHETMLTIERADESLKLMMQVRNKILDAYKEIMRMQV